jgi:hypothetical protein
MDYLKTSQNNCKRALNGFMDSMEDKRYINAIEFNRAYSLECKNDTLLWLSGHLEIVKYYYADADSVIHYLNLIRKREDYLDVWSDSDILLSLALAYNYKNEKDSACFFFKKLEDNGDLGNYEKFYSHELDYCNITKD